MQDLCSSVEARVHKDDLVAIAAAAGLTKLAEKHLEQLAASIASARKLAGKLPTDLHWTEELALVFRLCEPKGIKR